MKAMASSSQQGMHQGDDTDTEWKTVVLRRSVFALSAGREGHSQLALTPVSNLSTSKIDFPIVIGREVRSHDFFGREDTLSDVHAALDPNHRPSSERLSICVLTGMGGIGKTQIALEYTYKHQYVYEAIFWIHAESLLRLASSYALIKSKLGIGSQATRVQEEIRSVCLWLESTAKTWLLVFDNVEDVYNLQAYIPNKAGNLGSILMTTRSPSIPFIIDSHAFEIQPFSEARSIKLLFSLLGRQCADEEEFDAASEMLEQLGGLPLAIATIAGYISRTRHSMPNCRSLLRKRSSEALFRQDRNTFLNDQTLDKVFDVSLKSLPQDSVSVLHVLAFLDPDAIQENMLVAVPTNQPSDVSFDTYSFLKAIRTLVDQALIRRADVRGRSVISLHRLVQKIVLCRLARDPKAFQKAFQEASNIIQMQLPPSSRIQVSQPGAGYKYKKYMAQIMSLSTRSHILPLENPSLDFAQLMSDTGTFMWQNGLFLESEALINTGMDVLERSHVNNSELLSDLHILLGTIGDHVGVSHREMSLKHRVKALGLRRYVCHATESGGLARLYDIRLWSAEAEFGCALLQEQRFTEAEAIFDRCLLRYKSWGSEEEFPFEYAKYHSYMAFVRTSQGRFEEAIKLATHACNLQLMHEGPQSLLFLLYRFALANQCFYAGNHQHALDIHLNVLEFRRRLCGEHNPLTLESYSVIGAVLHAQNRHEESRHYLERCLAVTSTYWFDEGFAMAHARLSAVLESLGEEEGSRFHEVEALQIRKKFLTECPDFLLEDPNDTLAVYDQMISIWAGRYIRLVH